MIFKVEVKFLGTTDKETIWVLTGTQKDYVLPIISFFYSSSLYSILLFSPSVLVGFLSSKSLDSLELKHQQGRELFLYGEIINRSLYIFCAR